MRLVLLQFLFFLTIIHGVKSSFGSDLLDTFRRFIRSTCHCASNECCSKWGYCGKTEAYCGEGCRLGPCKASKKTSHSSYTITSETFACVFPNIDKDLRARRFEGFAKAMEEMKWTPADATEAAIFLSHVSHETDGLKTLVEYCAKLDACNNYQSSWCTIQARPNVKYYGRGWFQLSYPCNYYNAGKALDLDLLANPDLVSKSDQVSASTAIWYYKETQMNLLAQKGKFGETTRKLNEYECSGKAGHHMQAGRIETYHKVRKCFALPATTENLSC